MSFSVQYPVNCADCGIDIQRGQQGTYCEDGVIHTKCPTRLEICHVCNMQVPASGECCE